MGHAHCKSSHPATAACVHWSCLCLCCETYAQGVAEPLFTLRQVGANVWAAMSNRTADTGFVIGDDGVLVIDTAASVDGDGHFSLEHGTQLLAAIRKLTNLPVKYVINSADDALRSNGIESSPSGEERMMPSNGRLTAVCTPRPVV